MSVRLSPQEKFNYVFVKARSLLILRNVGELRRPIENFTNTLPRLPRLLPNIPSPSELVDTIKNEVDSWAAATDDALCEMVIVLCVTALEVYLEEVYYQKTGEEWGSHPGNRKLENVGALKRWQQLTGIDPFQSVEESELATIFEIRHVVVHKGGIIDQISVDRGLNATPNQPLRDLLSLDITYETLNKISGIVSSVEDQLKR